ncbi:protein NLP3-like [Rutidosis leptorrhynchoides]|uniref:protein NLP3-like n=1 Tax=Rutidosis leptorrhynchoides TaxID=125765 RepID=UPI003A98FE81
MGTPEGGELVVVGDIMRKHDVSKFLKILRTYCLHKTPESDDGDELWVFDSQDEVGGSDQHNSLSVEPDISLMIRGKIKSVLSMMKDGYPLCLELVEFWAPVVIDSRLQLSTSGQPFAFANPEVELAEYRIHSEGYTYNIMDVNYANNKQPMIITAFLGRFTQIGRYNSPVDDEKDFNYLTPHCVMIPVCCPSQSSSRCIGVFWLHSTLRYDGHAVLRMMNIALEKAGLSMFHVQNRIPYKIVHGLKPARDQIEDAIKIVCELLNIELAQVWITNHEDENHVPFSSSLQHVQKKQTLALKLTGYYNYVIHDCKEDCDLPEYYHLCDMVPLDMGESRIEKTLADYESRFYKTYDKLNKNQLQSIFFGANGIVICLKSIDTRDMCYAFEFIWRERVILLDI